ncbi:MAG: anaerobic ribonucleoside triphosphate reductase [Breznakia sp.]
MINKIKKRDGREIQFTPEKITRAIFLAASAVAKGEGVEADYEEAEVLTDRVVGYLNSLYKQEVPSVEQVQDAVVRTLIESGHAKTSEAYILYRSDRTRMRNIHSQLMKSIREITYADAKESDMKRDNANIDGNTAMGTMLQYGSAVSKEFCLNQVISPKFARMHIGGDIHIHDLDFMNMGTLTCCQIDLDTLFRGGFSTGHGFLREPQDIASYAALAAIAIQSNQNDQHGGQSIPAFDFYLAKGVAKTFRKRYLANLKKAIYFVVGNDVDIEEDMIKIEKTCKASPSLEMDYTFLDALNKYLKTTFRIGDEKISEINVFTYKEARDECDQLTYQAMEGFIHNLNTMHSRAGAQVPFSSINFGTDTSTEGRMLMKNLLLAQEAGLGNGETPIFPILIFKVKEGVNYNPNDPNYDLFQLSIRVSAKRLFPNFVFVDAPFNSQYYREGDVRSEIATMGCRTRVISNVNGEETSVGRGNNSFTTINLPRLGIKHGVVGKKGFFDRSAFFAELEENVVLVIEQLLERGIIQSNKKVKNFPFLMGQGVWMGADAYDWEDTLDGLVKNGTYAIGFIGLAECLVALIAKHHGESEEAQALGLEIVGFMRKCCDDATKKYHLNIGVIATPAEGLSGRFTKQDRDTYGKIKGVTDRAYYTNSNHVPVHYPLGAFDKIKIEAPYHALTNAGHITYVELDGDPLHNLDAFEAVVRCMKESGIGYGSINHPLDRDPICGFSGVLEGDVCPKCGRDENDSDIKFDRIRRITGYLVGTLDRFNNGKAAEEKDRVKHSVNAH